MSRAEFVKELGMKVAALNVATTKPSPKTIVIGLGRGHSKTVLQEMLTREMKEEDVVLVDIEDNPSVDVVEMKKRLGSEEEIVYPYRRSYAPPELHEYSPSKKSQRPCTRHQYQQQSSESENNMIRVKWVCKCGKSL